MTELKTLPRIARCDRLITHANCPDGIASAMLARLGFPECEVVFIGYQNPDAWAALEAREGDVFCDMAPPRDRAQEWVDVGAWCLDHHKHAADVVALFGERGVFADEKEDPGVSGAVLANACLFGSEHDAYHFAHLAGIRDTWQKDNPEWDLACQQAAVLMHHPAEYWIRGCPLDQLYDANYLIDNLGPLLLADRAAKVAKVVESGMVSMRDDAGRKWCIHPDPEKLSSDVGEAARGAGFNASLGYQDVVINGEIQTIVSLRSDETIDVGAIAKANGGGGHSRAAGFRAASLLDALDAVGFRSGFSL